MRNQTSRARGAADLLAGASVALVLIPQAMAYAELAGLPPQVGLFASALPLILAAPFGSSIYLQTGPVALTSLLTFGALKDLADPFSDRYIELAVMLALMIGLIRLLLGVLRLGSLAYLLSNPVLTGFTTAAAVLIISSQLPRAVGATPDKGSVLANAFATLRSPQDWDQATLFFAIATAAIMLIGRRLNPLFPGVLIALIASTIISKVTNYDGSIIGELPGGMVTPNLDFPWDSTLTLLPSAIAIALVGFAEPSSIARSYAAQDRTTWDANREMIGQGVANVTSAISGGLPVSGSFSRSALGRLAGAKTRWAGAITGIIVLVSLPFVPLVEPLPRAVLAAIVITSVAKLIKLSTLAKLFKESAPQALVGCGTFAATLAFAPSVERGVFVGVALAIGVHLYRELNITTEHTIDGTILTVCPQGVLWFATVPQIERMVRRNLAEHHEIETVRINLAGVGRLDYTGAATLKQVTDTFTNAGAKVEICNIPPGAKRAAGIHLGPELTNPPEPFHSVSS